MKKGAFTWVLRLTLGLILLGLVMSHGSTISTVAAVLRRAGPWTLLGAVLFYLAGQLLSAWKWQLLLAAQGTRVSFWSCCRWYWAGMFGNLWLPTNVGGDGLRAYLLTKACPKAPLAQVAASILMERLTGFAALLVVALAGVLLAGAGVNGARGILLGSVALLVVAGLLWLLLRRFLSGSGRWAAKIERVHGAIAFFLQPRQRGVLGITLFFSLVFQVSQVLLNIALAVAAGLVLPILVFWWLAPLLSLSGLVPVGIGGLGVREAAAVALLHQNSVGAQAATIVGWSLLWQATVWLASLPGCLFMRAPAASPASQSG
jgi:uncharacterized membrane protein YbhN (UPF0104 family)